MNPELNKIYQGDSLEILRSWPDEFIDTIITSPPYWGLRDYGTGKWIGGDSNCTHQIPRNKGRATPGDKQSTNAGSQPDTWKVCGHCGAEKKDLQLGLEKNPEEYVAKMTEIFREIRRALKKEGTCWVNIGDTYSAQRWTGKGRGQPMNKFRDGHRDINPEKLSGLPDKNLVGIPWRVAFALQADGWYLRQGIIWAKPNPMPESVTDRCTKSHEYIFLLSKNPRYYFDHFAIQEKSIWFEHDKRATEGPSSGGKLKEA